MGIFTAKLECMSQVHIQPLTNKISYQPPYTSDIVEDNDVASVNDRRNWVDGE